MTDWQLRLSSSAERSLARLSERIVPAVVEFMVGPLIQNPLRVGKALQRELDGYHAARRGSYHIVYRVDLDTATVLVVRVEHRSTAYRGR